MEVKKNRLKTKNTLISVLTLTGCRMLNLF